MIIFTGNDVAGHVIVNYLGLVRVLWFVQLVSPEDLWVVYELSEVAISQSTWSV